jgi:hypothetical protein
VYVCVWHVCMCMCGMCVVWCGVVTMHADEPQVTSPEIVVLCKRRHYRVEYVCVGLCIELFGTKLCAHR